MHAMQSDEFSPVFVGRIDLDIDCLSVDGVVGRQV